MAADAWDSGQAYEPYMGRWSRLVAAEFLRWLPAAPSSAWCDIGCGTGALSHAILTTAEPSRVVGVDPSVAYLAAATARITDPRFEVREGSAAAIPAGDGEFDRVVSALMLNFVPDDSAALAEMRRVARQGGTVAAYVWDYSEGMGMLRAFWDAAVALDPAANELDEGRRFPLCRPEPLRELFASTGLLDVAVHSLDIATAFADFDDFWRPFLGGQAPAAGYCAGLPDDRRVALREHLRATLPRAADGTISLTARAWAVRATTP
jgi:SAM-dependent methyltransferase